MDMSEMPPVEMEEDGGGKPNRLFVGAVIAMVALLIVGLVGVVLFRMRGSGATEVAELTPTPSGAAVAAQSLATTAPSATPTARATNTPVVLLPRTDTSADTAEGPTETPTIDIGGDVAAEGGAGGAPTETPTIDIGGGTTEKGGVSSEPTETPTIDIGGGAGSGPTPTSVIKGPTVIVIPANTPTSVVPVDLADTTVAETGFGLEALLGGAALSVILLIARRLRLTK